MRLKHAIASIGLADVISHVGVGCAVGGVLLLASDLDPMRLAYTMSVAVMCSLVVTALWRAIKVRG